MARNVNVVVSSENDSTTRDGVPDWLIHFNVDWVSKDGTPHNVTQDEYFLLLLNWLKTNHPAAAKRWMEQTALAIARIKYGVDAPEDLV